MDEIIESNPEEATEPSESKLNVEIVEEIKQKENIEKPQLFKNNLNSRKDVKSSWDKVCSSFLVLKSNKSSLRNPSQKGLKPHKTNKFLLFREQDLSFCLSNLMKGCDLRKK